MAGRVRTSALVVCPQPRWLSLSAYFHGLLTGWMNFKFLSFWWILWICVGTFKLCNYTHKLSENLKKKKKTVRQFTVCSLAQPWISNNVYSEIQCNQMIFLFAMSFWFIQFRGCLACLQPLRATTERIISAAGGSTALQSDGLFRELSDVTHAQSHRWYLEGIRCSVSSISNRRFQDLDNLSLCG